MILESTETLVDHIISSGRVIRDSETLQARNVKDEERDYHGRWTNTGKGAKLQPKFNYEKDRSAILAGGPFKLEPTVESGKRFHEAIKSAAAAHAEGNAVTVQDEAFYESPAVEKFLTPDGNAGAAVAPDGELISVFKKPGTPSAEVRAVLANAAKHAKYLMCFDTRNFLPGLYSQYGYRPASRVSFNEEFAPKSWDYKSNNHPHVLFMVHDPEGTTGLPDQHQETFWEKIPTFSTKEYESAHALALKYVSKLKTTGAAVKTSDASDDEDILKASHIKEYQRTIGGKVVTVHEHEDKRKKGLDYHSEIGSFRGAVKIGGKWVSVKNLNHIEKPDWIRWQGPASDAIQNAMKDAPQEAKELFPENISQQQQEVAKNNQTDTPEFKAWFGDSKVVDKDGKPMVVYRGHEALGKDKVFDTQDDGIHFTGSERYAKQYAEDFTKGIKGNGGEGEVTAAYIKMERPIDLRSIKDKEDFLGRFSKLGIAKETDSGNGQTISENAESINKDLKGDWSKFNSNAYELTDYMGSNVKDKADGIIFQELGSKELKDSSFIVFHPTQIKSVFNRGTWNPKDPSISASDSAPIFPRHTPMSEGGMNRLCRNAETISNLLQCESFRLHGFGGLDAPSQREVLHCVESFGCNREILNAVVSFVPVNVVNILAGKQLPANALFCNKAVLQDLLAADSDGLVTTAVDVADSLVGAVTGVAAKIRGIVMVDASTGSEKYVSAAGTNKFVSFHADNLPNQAEAVKLIGNKGTWNKTNPDITASLAERAMNILRAEDEGHKFHGNQYVKVGTAEADEAARKERREIQKQSEIDWLKENYPATLDKAEAYLKTAHAKFEKFDAMLGEVTKEAGSGEHKANMKSGKSLAMKVIRHKDADYSFGSPKDHVRGVIFLDDWSQVPAIANALAARGKFKGESSLEKGHNAFGYRALMISTSLGDGINGEIQLHTKDSWALKRQTDEIYAEYRKYDKTDNSELPKELRKAIIAGQNESHELWDNYWAGVGTTVKALASASVNGLESRHSPIVPLNGIHLPLVNSRIGLPAAIGAASRTLPSGNRENLEAFITANLTPNRRSVKLIKLAIRAAKIVECQNSDSLISAAEKDGHPFHGNQFTGGKPEDFGLTKSKGSLGRLGFMSSNDPALRISAMVTPGRIFITRLDAVEAGKGHGGKALEKIKQFAEATGRKIELTAGADTPELQGRLNSFYEKHGFKKTDSAQHPSFVWEPTKIISASEMPDAMAVCPKCKALVNLSKEPEICMGAVACPKCKSPVTQEHLSKTISRTVTASSPKRGCLIAMLPSLETGIPNWAAENISADTLAEDGIETEIHATVLYGFNLNFASLKLKQFLFSQMPIKGKLGKLSRFECPEYDVIKFSIKSPGLIALNKKLADEFPDEITPSEWSYKPHVTVAYVKKGTNQNLNASQFEGHEFTVNQLLYSLPEKKGRIVISLFGTGQRLSATSPRLENLTIRAAQVLTTGSQSSEPPASHRQARDAAQAIYEAAVIAAATKAQHEKEEKKREDAIAAILLLLLLAGEDAYQKTYSVLDAAESKSTDEIQIGEQAKTFAAERQDVLGNFAGKLHDTLEETKTQAEADELTPAETARELRQAAQKVSTVMADTEAQCTFGSVEIVRLRQAGFKSAVWMTCDDDRVRPSHVDCGNQGPVLLGKPFVNGLYFPGDPKGPASETCGCRCWLVGYERKKQNNAA